VYTTDTGAIDGTRKGGISLAKQVFFPMFLRISWCFYIEPYVVYCSYFLGESTC
jgi:hypothetical protein